MDTLLPLRPSATRRVQGIDHLGHFRENWAVSTGLTGVTAAPMRHAANSASTISTQFGSIVATMLPNCVEMVLALFAAWRMGAAVTPVNPVLTAQFSRKWPR